MPFYHFIQNSLNTLQSDSLFLMYTEANLVLHSKTPNKNNIQKSFYCCSSSEEQQYPAEDTFIPTSPYTESSGIDAQADCDMTSQASMSVLVARPSIIISTRCELNLLSCHSIPPLFLLCICDDHGCFLFFQ